MPNACARNASGKSRPFFRDPLNDAPGHWVVSRFFIISPHFRNRLIASGLPNIPFCALKAAVSRCQTACIAARNSPFGHAIWPAGACGGAGVNILSRPRGLRGAAARVQGQPHGEATLALRCRAVASAHSLENIWRHGRKCVILPPQPFGWAGV